MSRLDDRNPRDPDISPERRVGPNVTNYRDGYAQGRVDESSSASGVMVGLLLALLAGAGALAWYLLSRPNPAPVNIDRTIVVPSPVAPSPQPKAPDINITVPNPNPVAPTSPSQSGTNPSSPANPTTPGSSQP